MKKITVFFIFAVLLSFVSCDTVTHYTMRVAVDRNPTLTIENRTGHEVIVTSPVSTNITSGAYTLFQPTETTGTINVAYMIGQVQFNEQVTMDNADATVVLTKRPPTITVVNQTGYQLNLTAPKVSSPIINDKARIDILAPALNQVIPITYRIGLMNFTEQVTMANQDVTVTLTRSPPWLTIVNNTGMTINIAFIRYSGFPGGAKWVGGNIYRRGDRIILTEAGGAQTNDISESIINRDSMRIWLGDLEVSGDGNTNGYRYDIRIDAGTAGTFVKSNVQILNDITLTFTSSDRP